MQQRTTVSHLFCDYLIEQQLRQGSRLTWVYPGYPLGAAGIGCHDDCLPQPGHTRIYQKSGKIGCLTSLQPSEPKLLMISHHRVRFIFLQELLVSHECRKQDGGETVGARSSQDEQQAALGGAELLEC